MLNLIFHKEFMQNFEWLEKYVISYELIFKQFRGKYTILGVLPIGHRSENINYRNVASVKSSSKLHVIRFLIGLLQLCHRYKSKLKIVNSSGKSAEIVPF